MKVNTTELTSLDSPAKRPQPVPRSEEEGSLPARGLEDGVHRGANGPVSYELAQRLGGKERPTSLTQGRRVHCGEGWHRRDHRWTLAALREQMGDRAGATCRAS